MAANPETTESSQMGHKEKPVISPKHTYRWLATRPRPFSDETLTTVASDVMQNARELTPKDNFWDEVFDEVTLQRGEKHLRGLPAIAVRIAEPIARTALEKGYSLDSPQIVRMGATYFLGTVTDRMTNLLLEQKTHPFDSEQVQLERELNKTQNQHEIEKLKETKDKIQYAIDHYNPLSDRDLIIIRALALGKSNKEVAMHIHYHYSWTQRIIHELQTRFNVENNAQLVSSAIRMRILKPAELVEDFERGRYALLTDQEKVLIDAYANNTGRVFVLKDLREMHGIPLSLANRLSSSIAAKLGSPLSPRWVTLYWANKIVGQEDTIAAQTGSAERLGSLLTEEQKELLIAAAKGIGIHELGKANFMSGYSIQDRYEHIFDLLGVRDKTRAIIVAIQRGYLPEDRVVGDFNLNLFRRLSDEEISILQFITAQEGAQIDVQQIWGHFGLTRGGFNSRLQSIRHKLNLPRKAPLLARVAALYCFYEKADKKLAIKELFLIKLILKSHQQLH